MSGHLKIPSGKKPFTIRGLRLLRWIPALLQNPLPALVKISRRYGHILTFDAGKYQRIHVVSDPNFVKHILKTEAEKYRRSTVIKALKPLLGDGIFIAEDSSWKRSHALLKPAMHEQYMRSYLAGVDAEMEKVIKELSRQNHINIEPHIEDMMLRILFKTMFGIAENIDYRRIIKSHKAVLKAASIEQQKLRYFKNKLFGKRLAGKVSLADDDLAYLQKVAAQVLAHASHSSAPLMAHLMGENCTHEEKRDMVLNLLFAGYDTTASALSWTLYCLAKHPKWQEKILDEYKNGEGHSVKMVVQEAMRLHPPVWSVHRQLTEGDNYEDYAFEAGSYFMICIHSLHRHPDIWAHPDTFYPEHFTSENMKGKAFAYIPFGQGQRMCIGKPLASQELEYLVPRLLEKLAFSSKQKQEIGIKPDIISKSKKGIWVEVDRRL